MTPEVKNESNKSVKGLCQRGIRKQSLAACLKAGQSARYPNALSAWNTLSKYK